MSQCPFIQTSKLTHDKVIRDKILHIRNTNNQISKSNITFITIQKSICACSRVFCSVIVCLNICVCAYLLQNNIRMYNEINIHRSEVYCGSAFEPGSSGLPYYCTPPVCVPAVLGALAVWRLSTNKKKAGSASHVAGCLLTTPCSRNGARKTWNNARLQNAPASAQAPSRVYERMVPVVIALGDTTQIRDSNWAILLISEIQSVDAQIWASSCLRPCTWARSGKRHRVNQHMELCTFEKGTLPKECKAMLKSIGFCFIGNFMTNTTASRRSWARALPRSASIEWVRPFDPQHAQGTAAQTNWGSCPFRQAQSWVRVSSSWELS